MIVLLNVAFKSLLNRKTPFILSIISISLSIILFLGVNRIKEGTKESFANTVSQADLIIGARGSGLQLLLYTIFHLGNATNNISWSSYENIKSNPNIDWVIPFSLGDSYRGYRVIATNENFYAHYRYLGERKIELAAGNIPIDIYGVALGAQVAKQEKLKVGDRIILSHGISQQTIFQHADNPFVVTAVLKETNTPVDRALYITLEGMEAIHIDWQDGIPQHNAKSKTIKKDDIHISSITSILARADNRINTLSLMRNINEFKKEPLMAVIPGSVLSQLWETVSYAEAAFEVILIFVILIGIFGMMISIYTSLDSRRRELAILRAIGASHKAIIFLLISESFLTCTLGCLLGYIVNFFSLKIINPFILKEFGIIIQQHSMQKFEIFYLLIIVLFACIIGIIPAIKAYKNSLTDGLSIRT